MATICSHLKAERKRYTTLQCMDEPGMRLFRSKKRNQNNYYFERDSISDFVIENNGDID